MEGACVHSGDIIGLVGGQCKGGKNTGMGNLQVICASVIPASPKCFFSDVTMEMPWVFLNRGQITDITLLLVQIW